MPFPSHGDARIVTELSVRLPQARANSRGDKRYRIPRRKKDLCRPLNKRESRNSTAAAWERRWSQSRSSCRTQGVSECGRRQRQRWKRRLETMRTLRRALGLVLAMVASWLCSRFQHSRKSNRDQIGHGDTADNNYGAFTTGPWHSSSSSSRERQDGCKLRSSRTTSSDHRERCSRAPRWGRCRCSGKASARSQDSFQNSWSFPCRTLSRISPWHLRCSTATSVMSAPGAVRVRPSAQRP